MKKSTKKIIKNIFINTILRYVFLILVTWFSLTRPTLTQGVYIYAPGFVIYVVWTLVVCLRDSDYSYLDY